MGSVHAAIGKVNDAAVVELALANFTTRSDTMTFPADGISLVAPKGDVLKREDMRVLVNNVSRKCKISSAMIGELIHRNEVAASAEELIEKTPRWRVMSTAELTLVQSGSFLGTVAGDEKVRTILWLSKPAFSTARDRALVHFKFLWSIHGADAYYVLRKRSNIWKVDCSDLFHWP